MRELGLMLLRAFPLVTAYVHKEHHLKKKKKKKKNLKKAPSVINFQVFYALSPIGRQNVIRPYVRLIVPPNNLNIWMCLQEGSKVKVAVGG